MPRSLQQRRSTLVAIAAGSIALISLAVLYSRSKRRRKDNSVAQARGGFGSSDDDENGTLTALFEQAAAQVAAMPDGAMSQGDKLMMYGLYKQATAGNVNISPPSRLNIVAYAKYMAWGKFGGLPRETAMIKYIEASHHFAGGENTFRGGTGVSPMMDDNDDIVYSEEDEYDSEDENDGRDDGKSAKKVNDSLGTGGMGIRPSTLAAVADGDLSSHHANGKDIFSSLRKAASDANAENLQSALDAGADVSETDEAGQTALHFAADRGAAECLAVLIKAGGDSNAVDGEGISVLQAAVIGGNVDAVKLLLEAGADPDHEDIDGDTPRSCAGDDGSEEMRALFTTDNEDDDNFEDAKEEE